MVKDYITIGTDTPMNAFNRDISKVMLSYNKLHKPFDEPCARLEFRDKLDMAEKESERRHGFIKFDEIKIEIGDLDRYGDADRFVLIEDQEDYVDRVIEGSRTQIVVGHTLSYVCKKRGHGISVFVPSSDYEKMKADEKAIQGKKVVEKVVDKK